MRRSAHGTDRRTPGGSRHSAGAGAPVGALAAHPAAPVAGRTAQAGEPTTTAIRTPHAQAAACTYRIANGPRAGHKVLTLRGAMAREGTGSA